LGERVYVVGGEPETAASVSRILAPGNCLVDFHPSAEALLQLAAGGPVGPILLDVGMLGVAGLRRLREHGLLWPVIATGPSADARLAAEALKAGACDFIVRPFDAEELRLILADVAVPAG
jgi:FixJ family two-component response regulator